LKKREGPKYLCRPSEPRSLTNSEGDCLLPIIHSGLPVVSTEEEADESQKRSLEEGDLALKSGKRLIRGGAIER